MSCFEQLKLASEIGESEIAKTICLKNGKIYWGSEAKGDSHSVTLFTRCPEGGKTIGTYHSHPGGTTEPSSQDLKAMRQAGLEHLCISDDNETRCYRVR